MWMSIIHAVFLSLTPSFAQPGAFRWWSTSRNAITFSSDVYRPPGFLEIPWTHISGEVPTFALVFTKLLPREPGWCCWIQKLIRLQGIPLNSICKIVSYWNFTLKYWTYDSVFNEKGHAGKRSRQPWREVWWANFRERVRSQEENLARPFAVNAQQINIMGVNVWKLWKCTRFCLFVL